MVIEVTPLSGLLPSGARDFRNKYRFFTKSLCEWPIYKGANFVEVAYPASPWGRGVKFG